MSRYYTVREVRCDRGYTQQQVGGGMGIGKSGSAKTTVSRLETTNGFTIFRLKKYVEVLGGKLEVVAKFNDGKCYSLAPFSSGTYPGGTSVIPPELLNDEKFLTRLTDLVVDSLKK